MVVPVGFATPSLAQDLAQAARERDRAEALREQEEREALREAATQERVEEAATTTIGGGLVRGDSVVAIQEAADQRAVDEVGRERVLFDNTANERFELDDAAASARQVTEEVQDERDREDRAATEAVRQRVDARDEIVTENAAVSEARTNFAQSAAGAAAQGQQADVQGGGAANRPGAQNPNERGPERATRVSSVDITS